MFCYHSPTKRLSVSWLDRRKRWKSEYLRTPGPANFSTIFKYILDSYLIYQSITPSSSELYRMELVMDLVC